MRLPEVCKDVAAALAKDDAAALLPKQQTLEAMNEAALRGFADGDEETREAVSPFIDDLVPATQVVTYGSVMRDYSDAEAARILLDAISALSKRCAAAGSEALR